MIVKAKNANAKVVNITELIQNAFIDKYLLTPLYELPNKVVYINFPVAKNIENPSEREKNAATRTIGTLRNNLKEKKYPDIYENEDPEYIKDVLDGWKLNNHVGYDTLMDKHTKYVNITDGHREIKRNGKRFVGNQGKVLFFGNSVMYGIGSDDENTLPSLFAKYTDLYTENRANFSMNDFVRSSNLIKSMKFNDEDVIVIGLHLPLKANMKHKVNKYIDMQPYFNHPRMYDDEVFVDMTHLNKHGYKLMAETLIKNLEL